VREEREEENGRRSVGWRGERKRDIGRGREGERERGRITNVVSYK
jgi:hypothetical protein